MRRPGTAAGRARKLLAAAAASTVAIALLGLPADGVAAEKPLKAPPTISCSFSSGDGRMSIVIRETRFREHFPRGLLERFPRRLRRQARRVIVEPTTATIERRGDAITVLSEEPDDHYFRGSGPASCKGGNPTVGNTDTIEVRNGKRTKHSNLIVDQTYGNFAPGLTDEGDGSSEIELDVAIAGLTRVRMSRVEDSAHVSPVGARTAVNLNAGESMADNDMFLGRRGSIILDGAGAADALSTDASSALDEEDGLLILMGGQGRDLLDGSPGSDAIIPGSGADAVETGSGIDSLLLSGRAADTVDCGPGVDFVFVYGRGGHDLSRCEKVVYQRDYGRGGFNNSEDILRVPPRVEQTVRRLQKARRG